MDLSKLTIDQLKLAEKIAAEAEKQGINPSFVLPMVMAESGFNPVARSPKDAYGVMQLTKGTAETLGVDRDDVDQNIAGGVKLLKQLVNNKNIGNDPHKVLIGYNAGPNTKFFKSGDFNDLPNETLNHIVKVSDFYGGNLPNVLIGENKNAEEEKAAEVTLASDAGETVSPGYASDIPGGSSDIKPALGVVGGGAGLGTATAIETTKKVAPLLPNIINAMTPGREVNPNLPQSRMSLQRYLNSQIAPNLKLPLSELEKVSGAGKIRTMSEVQNALKAIQAVEERKIAKPMVRMVPGRPGVFEQTGQVRTSTTPGRPGVDLTPYEMKPSGPVKQAVARELTTAGEVGRAVAPSLGKIALGGLGGAGAMMSGYDAYELAKKIEEDKKRGVKHETYMGMTPDEWRLASKSAATVGGGLGILPFGVTQIGGLALSSPEMIMSAIDWYKNRGKPESSSPPSGLPQVDGERLVPQ
jgi:hypothetical protein